MDVSLHLSMVQLGCYIWSTAPGDRGNASRQLLAFEFHTHRSHFPPPQVLWHVPGSPLDIVVPIFSEDFEDHCFTMGSDCYSLLSQIAVVMLCFLWSLLKPCWMWVRCSCVNEVDLLALCTSPMSIFPHWGRIQKAAVQSALEEIAFRKFLIMA